MPPFDRRLELARRCGTCGGHGWHAWRPRDARTGRALLVWCACADCNDDEHKPKPELCEGCGETEFFCLCTRAA